MEIKLNEKSKTILMKVHSADDVCSDCRFAVVELSPELVNKAFDFRNALIELKVKHSSVYKIEEFDYSCDYIGEVEYQDEQTIDEILYEFEDTHIGDGGTLGIDGYDREAKGLAIARTDGDCLEVTSYDIRFSTYVKHTNTLLETEAISFDHINRLFPQLK